MAVVVKYVVERNGVEKMTFAGKAEADAYDKMLDMSEEILQLLATSQLCPDDQQQEALAFFLAQHKDELLQALGAKSKPTKKEKVEAPNDAAAPDNVQAIGSPEKTRTQAA